MMDFSGSSVHTLLSGNEVCLGRGNAMWKIRAWPPWPFLLINVGWLAALIVTAFGLASKWGWLTSIHDPFGGVVPFAVPWAGALGGVAISLVGIADHQLDWEPARYAYWHLVRPLLGLLFGTVAVLVIILLLDTVKVTQQQGHYATSGTAVLAVISFVVGYREATFRALVTRVVDVVLGPATTGAAGALALVPSLLDFGEVPGGQTATRTTHLFNASSDTVHITPASVTTDDAAVTVGAFAAQDLKPNDSVAIELTWAASAGGTLDTAVRVTAANIVVSGRARGTSP